MVISIKEIGIVQEAEIDLSKKLIVLCGPNNAGKTYIAYTIYGLLKSANDRRLYRSANEFFAKFLGTSLEQDAWEVNLLDFIAENDYEFLRSYVSGFATVLADVFATDSSSFRRTKISITDINPQSLEKSIRDNAISFSFRSTPSSILHFQKPAGSTSLTFGVENRGSLEKTKTTLDPQRLGLLNFFIPDLILGLIFPAVFISPTQRTALNIFSTELSIKRNQMVDDLLKVQERTDKAEAFDILKEARRYTLPIRDSLVIAEDLVNLQKRTSPYKYLAEELENSILKGKITVSEQGEVQYSPHSYDSLKISVNLSGSMVNSLSGLVFYFRHLAKKGEYIILDEPELNLHPDNQIMIARFISSVIDAGFSVMVSTHSDYMIHEFNHMIMLKQVSEKNLASLNEKWGYTRRNQLDCNDMQVLLFTSDSPGQKVVAKDVPIDQQGFSASTIDEAIRQLNATSNDLFFATESEE